jgi:hypothetical protein
MSVGMINDLVASPSKRITYRLPWMRSATLKANAMACPTKGMLYGTKGALLPLTLLHLVALNSNDVIPYVRANGNRSSKNVAHRQVGVPSLLKRSRNES